jgi:hypothetical protein
LWCVQGRGACRGGLVGKVLRPSKMARKNVVKQVMPKKTIIYVHCFLCSVAQTFICGTCSLKLYILDDRLFILFTTTANSIQ